MYYYGSLSFIGTSKKCNNNINSISEKYVTITHKERERRPLPSRSTIKSKLFEIIFFHFSYTVGRSWNMKNSFAEFFVFWVDRVAGYISFFLSPLFHVVCGFSVTCCVIHSNNKRYTYNIRTDQIFVFLFILLWDSWTRQEFDCSIYIPHIVDNGDQRLSTISEWQCASADEEKEREIS